MRYLLALLMMFFFAQPALAEEFKPSDELLQQVKNMRCSENGGFDPDYPIDSAYQCVKGLIDNATGDVAEVLFDALKTALVGVFMIALILFGMHAILGGARQLQPETMTFMLKFLVCAAAVFLMDQGGGVLVLRDAVMRSGPELSNMVFTITQEEQAAGGGGGGKCSPTNQSVDPNNPSVFRTLDCLMKEIFGALDPETQENLMQKFGGGENKGMMLFAVLGSLWAMGPVGGQSFFFGMGIAVTLFMTFATALFIHIIALIALSFLFSLVPIFLPLVMFQYTRSMFDNYWKQILSYILQPMVMAAFISMYVLVIDEFVSNPQGLQNIFKVADRVLSDPNHAHDYSALEMARVVEAGRQGGSLKHGRTSIVEERPIDGLMQDYGVDPSKFSGNLRAAMQMAGGQDLDGTTKGDVSFNIKLPVLSWSDEMTENLTSEMTIMIITILLFYRFLQILPTLVTELTVGDRRIPNLARTEPISSVGNTMGSAQANLQKGMQQVFK